DHRAADRSGAPVHDRPDHRLRSARRARRDLRGQRRRLGRGLRGGGRCRAAAARPQLRQRQPGARAAAQRSAGGRGHHHRPAGAGGVLADGGGLDVPVLAAARDPVGHLRRGVPEPPVLAGAAPDGRCPGSSADRLGAAAGAGRDGRLHDGPRPEHRLLLRGSVMRSTIMRPRMRRALALSAAVGTLALSGPALPAAAEEVGPPALDPSKQAAHELTPFNYPQKQGCMAGNPNPTVIEEKPWSQLVLGFEQAHEQGLTGQGMKVAVIDTGVNAAHPRLRNVTDGGSSVPGGALRAGDGDGTMGAGIIAASPDPETGFVGVAPDAEILSIRQSSSVFRDDETNRTIGNTETMAQAINIAVDRQVDVINISQSSCQDIARASNYNEAGNQMLHNAVKRAYDAGIVVVAAAGNAGNTCQQNAPGSPSTAVLPAWFDDYVLTVASVNEQGAPSEFTVAGPWVDVAAPGENLIALDPGINGRGLVNQISTGDSGQMGPIQG